MCTRVLLLIYQNDIINNRCGFPSNFLRFAQQFLATLQPTLRPVNMHSVCATRDLWETPTSFSGYAPDPIAVSIAIGLLTARQEALVSWRCGELSPKW